MKTLSIFVALALTGVSLEAADFYLKPGATDFTVSASYTADEAGTIEAESVPGADDVVILPAAVFEVNGASGSFAVLSAVQQIKPRSGAKLVVTVADGVSRLVTPYSVLSGNNDATRLYGTLVKKGAGELVLGPADTELSGSGDAYRYAVNAEVVEGTLRYPENITVNEYGGSLAVSNGATVFMPKSPASTSMMFFNHIYAAAGSLITNDTTRSAGHALEIVPVTYTGYTDSEIAGTVGGRIRIWTQGNLILSGTNNTASAVTTINAGYVSGAFDQYRPNSRGTISLKSFGYAANEPSSIGVAGELISYGSGGGFRYLGTGETTTKGFQSYASAANSIAFLDGGPDGGLVFAGSLTPFGNSDCPHHLRRYCFTGSNRNECVWSGGAGQMSVGGTNFPMHITKAGGGVWRFADHPTRNHLGGVTVAEGTLVIESVADTNEMCSLGLGTIPTLDDVLAVEKGLYTDYSITLGSTFASFINGAPTLAYAGAFSGGCHTRKIALAGKGGTLSNATDSAKLKFYGINARDTGTTPTLVLTGGGTGENTAGDISDGAGEVSVVKRGAGTWTLDRDLTFSGDLRVEAGMLKIVKTRENPPYTWFRYSICQFGPAYSSTYKTVNMRELALYDATGARQNLELKPVLHDPYPYGVTTNAYADPYGLEPGEVTYATPVRYTHRLDNNGGGTVYTDLEGYFTGLGASSTTTTHKYYVAFETAPNLNDPKTWVTIVMRLTNGVPPITHFDLQNYSNYGTVYNWPKYAVWDGSGDGVHWNRIYDNRTTGGFGLDYFATNELGVVYGPGACGPGGISGSVYNSYTANLWLSDGKSYVSGQLRPLSGRTGYAFSTTGEVGSFSCLEHVASVSVAEGATLSTDDAVELKSLKIDAAGMGAVKGFSFAATGKLDITGAWDETAIVLPGTYEGCSGMENLSGWSLSLDGEPTTGREVVWSNGKLRLIKKGFIIILM
ncbi:MAG: autotransporter-associated beta strand repeat-containing protein [Kiritimatiellae bacterium]|nr:autotransporter-associated beta strand repeat-containing protein [Kiritimatiellia bacterium]